MKTTSDFLDHLQMLAELEDGEVDILQRGGFHQDQDFILLAEEVMDEMLPSLTAISRGKILKVQAYLKEGHKLKETHTMADIVAVMGEEDKESSSCSFHGDQPHFIFPEQPLEEGREKNYAEGSSAEFAVEEISLGEASDQKDPPPPSSSLWKTTALFACIALVLGLGVGVGLALILTKDSAEDDGPDSNVSPDVSEDFGTLYPHLPQNVLFAPPCPPGECDYPTLANALIEGYPALRVALLEEEGTCQWWAFKYFLVNSKDINELDSWRIRQRYVMALLYCEWKGDDWAPIASSDLWLSDAHECDWFPMTGVDPCNKTEIVIRLPMESNNLQGTLPPEVAMLTDLQSIQLAKNSLQGVIPMEWSVLSSLQELSLKQNAAVSGLLPAVLGQVTLEELDVSATALSGVVDTSAWQVGAALRRVNFASTSLTGNLEDWCDIIAFPSLAVFTNVNQFNCSCCITVAT
jgi:hypothetical protein